MKFFFTTIQPFSKYASYKRATGLGEGLSALGHEVFIAALDCEENKELLNFESPHCQHVFFPRTNAISEALFKLKVIHRIKPDFVYSPTYGLRNLMGMRFLFPVRTKLIQEINELNSAFVTEHRTIWKTIELLGLFEADIQVCASINLQRHMNACCKKWRIRQKTLYSPFAYPSYLNACTYTAQSSAKYILYMGNLIKNYGIFELIEAFKLLYSKRNDINLIIVGTGPDAKCVQEFILHNGLHKSVILTGRVEECKLNEYLRQADAFVLPMHNTPQDRFRCPSKIYYYLAYSKPIVTCQIGDPYDTLGSYGFYYDPTDINTLSDAIIRAVDNSRPIYPQNFTVCHSWKNRAQELVNHIHSLHTNAKS